MERYIVFSDVSKRDGIGIEFYVEDTVVVEIFRDDAKRIKTITLYNDDFPLHKLQHYISVFDREIPTEFI